MDDDVEFHGPCPHCKRDLWLVLEDNVPAESVTKVHGFELPDGLGWFALADERGWTACPVCGWAIVAESLSLN
jgi:hypothetical protein